MRTYMHVGGRVYKRTRVYITRIYSQNLKHSRFYINHRPAGTTHTDNTGTYKFLQIRYCTPPRNMDKTCIFSTGNAHIGIQKVQHTLFSYIHISHRFRFLRKKSFIGAFKFHFIGYITFKLHAGTKFHRRHFD